MKAKKVLGILLAGAMALSAVAGLAACGVEEENNTPGNNTENSGNNNTGNNNGGNSGYSDSGTAGWYVVGTGKGSLSTVGWDSFQKSMKLKDSGDGYVSISLTLYNGDSLKFVYNDGSYTDFSAYDWDMLSFGYIGAENEMGNEMVGLTLDGDGNILIPSGESGEYTFKVLATATTNAEIYGTAQGVTFEKTKALDDIDRTNDFYLVGTISSKGMYSVWPDPKNPTIAEASRWVHLTQDGDTWTITLEISAADDFKVFNLGTGKYYLTGTDYTGGMQNISGAEYEGTRTVTVTVDGTSVYVEII